jgi:hypothetical protein
MKFEAFEIVMSNEQGLLWWVCPVCNKKRTKNMDDNIDNRCEIYKLGYRTKMRCSNCGVLFVTKDIKQDINKQLHDKYAVELKNNEKIILNWEKYREDEFNLPWHVVTEGEDNFVYNCVGDIVLGTEDYYPICNLNESMMKRVANIVNKYAYELKE